MHVLDGGLATELERAGAILDDPLWSARLLLDDPDAVRAVHRAYLEAGADVITTATYQATYEGLARRGVQRRRAESLLRRGVELALDERDAFWGALSNRRGRRRPLVAASVGSYGAYLADGSEYRGRYGLSLEELIAFHRDRLALLAGSGADLVALETVPSLTEAVALTALADRASPVPAWLAFSCRDGERIASGRRMEDCVRAVAGRDALIAVGVNCTPPNHVASLLHEAAKATDKPLVAYPNAGERWDARGRRWRAGGVGPTLADLGPQWASLGARYIGGCCRTTPDDISALRRSLARAGLL